MGEIADDIINGAVCEMCCSPFEDEGNGFPRICNECDGEDNEEGE